MCCRLCAPRFEHQNSTLQSGQPDDASYVQSKITHLSSTMLLNQIHSCNLDVLHTPGIQIARCRQHLRTLAQCRCYCIPGPLGDMVGRQNHGPPLNFIGQVQLGPYHIWVFQIDGLPYGCDPKHSACCRPWIPRKKGL